MRKISTFLLLVCICVFNTQAQIPTNGLVCFYSFNGNANDLSGNGNHGTVFGATLTTDRFGKSNKAYLFNGTNQYIRVPNSSGLDIIGNQITISAWVYTTVSNPISQIISKASSGAPADRKYGMYLNGTQKMGFELKTSNGNKDTTIASFIFTNQWVHKIIMYDGNMMYWYTNGQLDYSVPWTGNIVSNTNDLAIGCFGTFASGFFNGKIDDISIYNRSLSQDEISVLYNASNLENGLTAMYPFNGNANDASGNGNHGTIYGATLTTDRFGKADKAYSFNGTSNYIEVLDNPIMELGKKFTVSTWFVANSAPSPSQIIMDMISKERGSNQTGFLLDYSKDSLIGSGFISFTGNHGINGTQIIEPGEWTHVVLSYDGTTASLYLNGVIENQSTFTDSVVNSNLSWFIGKEFTPIGGGGNTNRFWNGKLDDIRFYNQILSAAEVKSLYYEGGYNITTPTVQNNSRCQPGTLTLTASGATAGTNYKWFASILGTTVINTGATFTTPVLSQTDTFYVCIDSAGFFSARVPVLAIVDNSIDCGIIATYPFNGNANDESGNGNHGTINGPVLTTDRFDNPNKAYSFNGTNNYITIADNSVMEIGHNFTVSTWFLNNAMPSLYVSSVISKELSSNTSGFAIYYNDAQKPGFGFNTFGSNHGFSGNTIIGLGEWTNVVVSYNGNIASIYVNGALDQQITFTDSVVNSNNAWFIGKEFTPLGGGTWGNRYWNGKIDDIRIYNRILNVSEIQSIYYEGGFGITKPIVQNKTRCEQGALTLTASGATPGTLYRWYHSNTDTTVIFTGANFTTPVLSQTDTFYVCIDSLGFFGARVPVMAIIDYTVNCGAVANYPFNGNANDESGNENHGTLNGPILTTDRFGNPNKAYYFDGTNDFIEIADNPVMELGHNFTVSTWFLSNAIPSFLINTVISKEMLPNQTGFEISYADFQQPGFAFITYNGNHGFYANSFINLGEWTNIVISYNGTTASMYINGVLDQQATFTDSIVDSNLSWFIGKEFTGPSGYGNRYWNGKIDDVRIYNRVLSATEVATLYHQQGYAMTVPSVQSSSRCGSGTVTLQAFGATGSETYRWYDSPVSETVIASGALYTTNSLSQTDTFYVAIDSSGFLSAKIPVIAFIFSAGQTVTDTINKFIHDGRDCQNYPIVKVNNQWWMKENLNIGTVVNSTNTGTNHSDCANNSIIEKYCYDNNTLNCDSFGGLYSWNELMNYHTTSYKGICPTGWFIPSDNFWYTMENAIDNSISDPSSTGWRGTNCGTKLKSGGSTGFEALLVGKRDGTGSFSNKNIYGFFWTSSESNSTYSFYRNVGSINNTMIYRGSDTKYSAMPVRCFYNPCTDVLAEHYISICTGDNYTIGSHSYSLPGTYIDTIPTYLGCDSIITTHLYNIDLKNVGENVNGTPLTVSLPPAPYCNTFGTEITVYPAQSGINYQLYVNGAAYGFEYTGNNNSLVLTSPVIDGVTTYQVHAVSPGTMCEKMLDTILTINPVSPQYYFYDSIICNGDSVFFANEWRKITGSFYDYTNCDSIPVLNLQVITISENITPSLITDTIPQGNTGQVIISTPQAGINYQLFINGNPYGSPQLGNTSPINFSIIPSSLIIGNNTIMILASDTIIQCTNIIDTTLILNVFACNLAANAGNDQTGCTGNMLTVSAVGAGGTQPYSFLWSNGCSSAINCAVTTNGTYTVSITDANGCIATDQVNVSFWDLPVALITGASSICQGETTTLNSSVTGGLSPYTYQWSPGYSVMPSYTITPQQNNTYQLIVRDAHQCLDTATIAVSIISRPATSAISGAATANLNETKIYFVTNNTGNTYTWQVTGGTITSGQGSYLVNIQWDTQGIGTVCVTEYNSQGCAGAQICKQVGVGFSCADLAVSIQTQDPSCYNSCNGSATAVITGGNPPYIYSWNDSQHQHDSIADNLCAGGYTVTVTDHYMCTVTETANLWNPSEITINVTTGSSHCSSADGYANTTITGGVAPFSFVWTSGDTTQNVNSLSSGMYMLTVTDFTHCQNISLVTINDQDGPVITVNSVQNLTCNQAFNGSIDISVSGGTTPYTYHWSSGEVTQDISNLQAGPYEIQVTDANTCSASSLISVSQPTHINVSLVTSESSCGTADGIALVNVTGGTTPYNYSWSNGSNTQNQVNLDAGMYYLTVVDHNGCSSGEIMVPISNNDGPQITIDSIISTSCNGNDGAIYITSTGGAQPCSFSWSNSATSEDITGLSSGDFSVTVTDQNGCIGSGMATIASIMQSNPQICMVLVDSIAIKNLIVWEKETTSDIDHYNIYREGSWLGSYFLIGTKNFNEESMFLDQSSLPKNRSYRYRITSVDNCGHESQPSNPHKTMFLAINSGVGNAWNLQWSDYEGFDFPGYYIWQHTQLNGWTLLDSIPVGYNFYTDNPPSQENLQYLVTVRAPYICNPALLKDMSGPFSQSLSNIEDNGIITVNIPYSETDYFSYNIYPNPTSEKVFVYTEKPVEIKIFNIIGKLIYSGNTNESNSVILDQKGIYMFELSDGKNKIYKKVVVQ